MSVENGANAWMTVPPEAAQRYVYYGVKGWLLFFLILFGLGSAVNVVQSVSSLLGGFGPGVGGGFRLGHQIHAVVQVVLGIAWLAVVWQGFQRNPAFPRHIILLFYIGATLQVAGLVLAWMSGMARHMAGGSAEVVVALSILVIIIVTALWVTYFRVSKRVNATYHHRLRRDDPSAAGLLT